MSQILLDLMMHIMDGFEFMLRIPEIGLEKIPPIIVITAAIEKAKLVRGIANVITKPIDLQQLYDAAEKLVHGWRPA